MAKSPEVMQQYMEEVEEAAEEVMSDRQEVITLDRRRNTNREALRRMADEGRPDEARMWICVGNMFLRMPRGFVKESIEKEQKHLDTEINNLRNGLRSKVNKLNDLEHKDPTLGTNLKALSQEEWQAVSQVLGK